jgi:hypothetical protein
MLYIVRALESKLATARTYDYLRVAPVSRVHALVCFRRLVLTPDLCVTSCLPLAVCAPPDSGQCQRHHPIHSTRCLPSQSYPSPLVHSRLPGSMAPPLCPGIRGPTSPQVHVPPRLPCFPSTRAAMVPLRTCELASLHVVHPSAPACLDVSCIRMPHARSIGELLSSSLGSDGRASGWALRLCRLLLWMRVCARWRCATCDECCVLWLP